MRFSHIYLLALLPLSFAGCRSENSAQAAPDTKTIQATHKASITTLGEASNGLALSISSLTSSTVYPGSKSQQRRVLSFSSPDDPHIKVILRNVSMQPISIHQEWNSWGYFNLSLEITKINGKTLPKPIVVKKRGRAWTRNAPTIQTIAPGETVVREIHFPPAKEKKLKASTGGDGYYSPFPFKSVSSAVYTMRAVFQDSRSDRQQYAPPVWTGKVASPLLDYVFG